MASRFEADPLYGAACESWQLQIGLAGTPGLVAAQQGLDVEGFHVVPAAALHVTVLPLIDAAEVLSRPKAALWSRHGPAWTAAIAAACARQGPFRLRFTGLRFDRRAVIAVDAANPLSALREVLAASCGLPERPVRVPTITHATLLRVRAPMLARRPTTVASLAVEVPVARLRLVHETVYPSLAVETLAEFAL